VLFKKENFKFQRQNVNYNLVEVFQHTAEKFFFYHLYRNLGTKSILTQNQTAHKENE